MRFLFIFMSSASFVLMLSGCGTVIVSTQWQHDAILRFNTAISADAEVFAPEETDNIRQTISLADRYQRNELFADADRLYRLSIQKSQLLYRNLVISKVAVSAGPSIDDEPILPAEKIDITRENGSLDNALQASLSEDQSGPLLSKIVTKAQQGQKSAPFSRTLERKSSLIKVPVIAKYTAHRADPARTIIYLTFDDGPSRLTSSIATFLKSEGIKATFFVLGNNIKGSEKAVIDTIAMGHQVGNHTLTHNLQKLRASFGTESNEIQRTGAMIERLGGDGKMVRIPYGASGKNIVSNVVAEGAQIYKWDINSNDSTQRGIRDHVYIEQTVLNQLNKSTKKHVILLFHDGAGHDSTLAALRDLIPRLKQQGYRFGLLARSEKIAHTSEIRQATQ